MLPASLIADCSSSPNSPLGSSGRRSISCASLMAVGRGNTSSVRPVRSPIMCMSTAAIGSSPSSICEGTSSSAAIVIVGTVIMIVLFVICDNAVAACPAPMFAVSRSASSCRSFNAVRSAIPVLSEKAPDIHDQRRRTIAEDRRTTEQRQTLTCRIELLDDDVLLPGELVHHQARAPLAHFEHDDLVARERPVSRDAQQVVEANERQHVIAQQHHFAPLYPPDETRFELHRLVHVRQGHRVHLVAHARQQR